VPNNRLQRTAQSAAAEPKRYISRMKFTMSQQ